MSKLKNIFQCVKVVGIGLFVLAVVTLILAALNLPGGLRLFSVQSGSMFPSITTGSLVGVFPALNYNVGDVITYKSEADKNNPRPKYTTTHRIVEVENAQGQKYFVTRGDANGVNDSVKVSETAVLGKVWISLPLLGYLVGFSRTKLGLVVLVFVPAGFVIISELLNIFRQLQQMRLNKLKETV